MASAAELLLLLKAKDQASATLKKVGGALKALGAAALVYAGAKGLGAIGKGLSDMVGMAEQEAVGIAKLDAALQAAGGSYAAAGGQIEAYLAAESQRIAMDDGEGRESLSRLTMATSDYTTALSLMPLTADLAAAKGMDLVAASELVGKVAAGNVSMLTRYGIVLQEGATASEALAAMQQRFAGQAEAFGNTSAGAAQKLKIAWDNAKEGFGAGFMGAFANVKSSLAGLLTKFGPAISTIGSGLGSIANSAFNTIKSLVSGVMASMGVDMNGLADDAQGWGQNIVLMLARGVAGAMRYVIGALAQVGQAITRLLRPGSPPKLLPNLDAWGTAAAAVYMAGWGEADLDAFDTLSSKIGSYLDTIPNMAQEKLIPLKAAVNAALAGAISGAGGVASGGLDLFDGVLKSIRKLPPGFVDYARSLMAAQQAQNQLTAAMGVLETAAAEVARAQGNLDRATANTARAQAELNRVTKQYDSMLAPLNKEMQAIQDKKQAIEDQKELKKLTKDANDKSLSAADRALAKLSIQEILKRQEITTMERSRDVAVDAEQQKVDAAQATQDAEQAKLEVAQEAEKQAQKAVDAAQQQVDAAKKLVAVQERLLGIQTDANAAIKAQNDLLAQMAAAAASAAAGLGAAMSGGGFEGALADIGFGDAAALGDMSGLQDQIAGIFDMGSLKDELAAAWGGAGGEGGAWSLLFPVGKGTGEFDRYGNEIMQAVPPFRERIQPLIDEVGTRMGDALIKGLGGAIGRGLKAIMVAIGDWEIEMIVKLILWADEVVTNIETGAANWLLSIQTGIANIGLAIATWFTEQALAFSTWFTGRLADLTTWLANVLSTFTTKFMELISLLGVWWETIKSVFTTKWSEAEAFLKAINLQEIGKDILQGLWNGLKSKWESVKSWLDAKARAVADIWRTITRTQSPSQVFASIGEDLMAGLDMGLIKGFGAVEQTTAAQAGALPGVMAPSAATGGGAQTLTLPVMQFHLVLDIPGLGATAETDVTVDTRTGIAAAQNLTLHASSKGV